MTSTTSYSKTRATLPNLTTLRKRISAKQRKSKSYLSMRLLKK